MSYLVNILDAFVLYAYSVWAPKQDKILFSWIAEAESVMLIIHPEWS